MGAIRQILNGHRRLALFCAFLALALRVLLPSGLMLTPVGKTLTVTICADASGLAKTHDLVIPAAPSAPKGHEGKVDGAACPYAALGMVALGGADAILLAAALALLMVLGVAAITPPRAGPAQRLRPPLRAPPAFA